MAEVESRECVLLESQGQRMFGVWHRPLGTGAPYPAVLVCHGFGGTKVGTFRLYVDLAKKLTRKGIGCLRFDYRGAGDSEGEHWDITIEGAIQDCAAALDWLRDNEEVDNTKLGIIGTSLGGIISLSHASRVPVYKSLAVWAPLYSTLRWINHFAPDTDVQDPTEVVVDGWPVGLDFVQQFMSVHMDKVLEKVSGLPLLHMHGEADSQVPVDHADDYEKRRKQAVGKSEFIRLPRGDHNFSRPEDRRYLTDVTSDWFKETLF